MRQRLGEYQRMNARQRRWLLAFWVLVGAAAVGVVTWLITLATHGHATAPTPVALTPSPAFVTVPSPPLLVVPSPGLTPSPPLLAVPSPGLTPSPPLLAVPSPGLTPSPPLLAVPSPGLTPSPPLLAVPSPIVAIVESPSMPLCTAP
jgi:hypothetical protein